MYFIDQGEGAPVVLLHGFPLSSRMWDRQVAALKEFYRVIVPDLAGFGQTPLQSDRMTMDAYGRDVLRLLDQLNIKDPVTLVGFSMGGYVALPLALSHPHRVGVLGLIDTKATADTPEAAANREKLALDVLENGAEAVARAMTPKLFAKGTAAANPALVKEVHSMMVQNTKEGIATALRAMAIRSDLVPRLTAIPCPTLLCVGEEDVISTPAEMEKMAELIPDAEIYTIPAAGHMAPMENPAVFNETLLDFLAGAGI